MILQHFIFCQLCQHVDFLPQGGRPRILVKYSPVSCFSVHTASCCLLSIAFNIFSWNPSASSVQGTELNSINLLCSHFLWSDSMRNSCARQTAEFQLLRADSVLLPNQMVKNRNSNIALSGR